MASRKRNSWRQDCCTPSHKLRKERSRCYLCQALQPCRSIRSRLRSFRLHNGRWMRTGHRSNGRHHCCASPGCRHKFHLLGKARNPSGENKGMERAEREGRAKREGGVER